MTEDKIQPDKLLTSTEVGSLLQVNPSSIKNWVHDGKIAAFRTPGGHWRIRAADLVDFLNEHRMPIPVSLADASRRRLLIVDDDTAQLRAYDRQLKKHAERVQWTLCANGIDALVQMGAFRPHLAVLDVLMPGLDGIEVCRRLKANPETKGIGVIITSGHLTPAIERDAQAAGALLSIPKPIDMAVVIRELGGIQMLRARW